MVEPKLTLIDRPELLETFVDHCSRVIYDGQTLRVDLAVTRLDGDSKAHQLKGTRATVSRLAMTPRAALQLHDSLAKVIAAMEAKGLVKRKDSAPSSARPQ